VSNSGEDHLSVINVDHQNRIIVIEQHHPTRLSLDNVGISRVQRCTWSQPVGSCGSAHD